jgi:hypothetical protein
MAHDITNWVDQCHVWVDKAFKGRVVYQDGDEVQVYYERDMQHPFFPNRDPKKVTKLAIFIEKFHVSRLEPRDPGPQERRREEDGEFDNLWDQAPKNGVARKTESLIICGMGKRSFAPVLRIGIVDRAYSQVAKADQKEALQDLLA